MNTQTLFQKISQKMRTDFEVTAQLVHSGSKGTARENILRNFLAEGRLPTKYAIGAGEVVGRTNDTSKQCDLVVYDRLNGVTLLYDESTQVYPIDCVYGIIEVKSTLSKSELIDALEKIKTLKAMAPGGSGLRIIGNDLVQCRARPFGVIFAYGLADNPKDKLLVSQEEAAQLLSISRRSVEYLVATKKLSTRRIGARALIPIEDVRKFARSDHPERMAG